MQDDIDRAPLRAPQRDGQVSCAGLGACVVPSVSAIRGRVKRRKAGRKAPVARRIDTSVTGSG